MDGNRVNRDLYFETAYNQAHYMDLQELWAQIRADLEQARNTLPNDATGEHAISEYEGFLAHNELELACDMLESYAETHAVSKKFWSALRDAAEKMELYERARKYERLAAV